MNKYFKRSEFACKCGCGQDTVDAELLKILTLLREHFESPVNITSANRCTLHNKNIGGSEKSQHLYSKAADIVVKDIEPRIVYDTLDRWYPGKYGLGSYDTFTHVDVREDKARW